MTSIITAAAEKIREKQIELNRWFEERQKGLTMPVTTSVDIRNAGFKICVIDTNVFPAGFNNLCNTFSKRTGNLFKDYFKKAAPHAKKILIVPETFTRNIPYFMHLQRLEEVLKGAGFEVAIGFLEHLPQNPLTVDLPNGEKIKLEEFATLAGDLILLNNDCSEGIPPLLQNSKLPIFPSPELGWHSRRKKHHFEIYCKLAGELAEILKLDCWLFCPITACEYEVDVENPKDMERVAKRVEAILEKTANKYKKYGIDEKPYAFVKSNAGTFGLGQMHLENPEDILNLNRKGKKKLIQSKGGSQTNEFIIQEGVMTIDSFEGAPIEPVLYLVGGELAGGFFRIHADKDNKASLNTPGSRFETLCFHKDDEATGKEINLNCKDHDDFFEIAKWLGKIAALSVALEEKDIGSVVSGP